MQIRSMKSHQFLLDKNFKKRFFNKIKKSMDNCWNWTGAKDQKGYGIFRNSHLGVNFRAHRISFVIHRKINIRNELICHRCDKPSCVNPKHLFIGSPKENTADMIKKGRARLHNPQKGAKHGMSKLKETDILNIRHLYENKRMTQKEIAFKYKMNKQHIHKIINKRCWKHI